MKNLLFLLFLSTIVLFTLSCSSSEPEEEENAEERIEKAAEDLGNASMETAASAMEEASKALRNLSKDEDGETVEVVDFRKLKDLLPERVAGLERTEASGERTGAMGMNISTAEGEYEDGNRRLQISMVDAGGIPMIMMGMAQWMNVEIDRESDDEYERTTTIKGYKAFERYNSRNKEGQISLVVADRYIVNIEGDNIEEGDLRKAVDALDLDDVEDLQ